MDTHETTGGRAAFVAAAKAKQVASKATAPDPLADKCWGLETNGDPELAVETHNGRVAITHYEWDDDGDREDTRHVDRDAAVWLRDRLTDAIDLLDAQAAR